MRIKRAINKRVIGMCKRVYRTYSLIELLMVMIVLGVLILLSTRILVSLVKISTATKAKTIARQESKFIETTLYRNFQSVDPDTIRYFDVQNRYFNDGSINSVNPVYTELSASNSSSANEVHFQLLSDHSKTVCFAYFRDISSGHSEPTHYLVRATMPSTSADQDCFSPTIGGVVNNDFRLSFQVLNTGSTNIDDFSVEHIDLAGNQQSGSYFVVNYVITPHKWLTEGNSIVNPDVVRQVVVFNNE